MTRARKAAPQPGSGDVGGNQRCITITETRRPPAAPTGLDLYPVDGAILARWDLGPEKDLSAYIVRWGRRWYNPFGGGWYWLSYNEMRVSASEAPHARLGGLTNGTSYSVMVRAVDASYNEGANSAIVDAQPLAGGKLPDAPTNLHTNSVSSTGLSLAWDAPMALPPYTFLVHYKKAAGDVVHTSFTTHTSATLSNLETGATYLIWVGQVADGSMDIHTGQINGWEGLVSDPLRVVITDGVDGNGDGLPDDWEAAHNFPSGPLPADLDHDGLSNADEYQQGTDPTVRDSDGDGFSDGEEAAMQTDPLSGLSYGVEHQYPGLVLGTDHLVFHAEVGQNHDEAQEIPFSLLPGYPHLDSNHRLQAVGNQPWLDGGFLETPHGTHFSIWADPRGLGAGFYSGAVRVLLDPDDMPLLGDRCVRVDLWVAPGEVFLPLVKTP